MPLKPYKRRGSEYDPAADFAEQLTRPTDLAAWLGGRTITATHDGATAYVDVAHGLGYRYSGADLRGVSAVGTYAVALTPDAAEAAGVDATRYVRISQGSATAMTSKWWVY